MTTATIAREIEQYLTPPKMDVARWEYAILRYEWALKQLDTVLREINAMGDCGWELADQKVLLDSIRQHPAPDPHLTLVFKRRTA